MDGERSLRLSSNHSSIHTTSDRRIGSVQAHKRKLFLFLPILILILFFVFDPPNVVPSLQAFSFRKPDNGKIIHPIPRLMASAQSRFKQLLSRQSKTLNQAVREYRRRYKIDPPLGFDEWFLFAMENDVKIIDEYDGLMRDLRPFLEGMSGAEVRRRVDQIGRLPSVDLVRLENGKTITINMEKGFMDSEVSARAKGFRVVSLILYLKKAIVFIIWCR